MNEQFPWPTAAFTSVRLDCEGDHDGGVADRQDRLEDFETETLRRSRILVIGAGGLAGAVTGSAIRKGIGEVHIADHDVVEVSNLNRQAFYEADLFQPKALRLAHNAAREGFLGNRCIGHHVAFTAESAPFLAEEATAALCLVDNNRTRAVASRFFRERSIPVIFSAINEGADYGWLFVQNPDGACLSCVFPGLAAAESTPQPCRAVPAVADMLHVLGGLTLYALDTLVMPRRRLWNFRSVHLVGGAADVIDLVERRPGCRLCAGE